MNATSAHSPIYLINAVPIFRPFAWLSKGWDDLLHHRLASLAYGLLVSVIGLIAFSYERHPYFVAAAITAFMLMGPLIAAGLCELSRCRDNHEPSDFDSSLKALRPNHDNLLGVANRLVLVSAAWFIISYLFMQFAFDSVAPQIEQTVWGDVLYHLSNQQIIAYLLSGAVLAVILFMLSVVTVPMIIDRHVDSATAIRTSMRVSVKDWPAMLVWALLFAALVFVGLVTYMVAMVVIFPLLGHATWYAYKDLVK